MKKNVGLFGGSFDPIHFGHINLAVQLLEHYPLDEVLFSPCFCSPFKTSSPPIASSFHRLAMLKLALEEIPSFKITTLEIDRKGPSFTIETVRALQSKGIQLHLLLSDDSAAHLDEWEQADELIRLAPPLIGARHSEFVSSEERLKTNVFEISSTEVRSRLKRGLYCGHLLPAKVLEYIRLHKLYH